MAAEDAPHANAENEPLFNQLFLDLEHALMGQVEVDAEGEVEVDEEGEGQGQEPQLFLDLEHALMGQVEVHAEGEGQGQVNENALVVPPVDLFGVGVQHLTNLNEPLLRNVINENLLLPVFDDGEMTVFAKLTRALIEEGGRNSHRPAIYNNLVNECNGEVNPVTVAGLGNNALVNLRVGGQLKAQAIISFAQSFQDENEVNNLPQLESEAIFERLKAIQGIGGYRALYMLVFGMRRLDYMPLPELTLRNKLDRLYGNQKPDYETWNPYKGLASWFIWKHVSQW